MDGRIDKQTVDFKLKKKKKKKKTEREREVSQQKFQIYRFFDYLTQQKHFFFSYRQRWS